MGTNSAADVSESTRLKKGGGMKLGAKKVGARRCRLQAARWTHAPRRAAPRAELLRLG